MDKQIIILGMHRSGTSLLSKLLISAGVDMGDLKRTGEPVYSNVTGHNEDAVILQAHEKFLAQLGKSWSDVPSASEIEVIKDPIKIFYKEYVGTKQGVWGVKDPRLCMFVEYLHEFLNNPLYVVIRRSEDDVSKSLSVRDGISISEGMVIQRKYKCAIDKFIQGKNYFETNYEDLTNNSSKTIAGLCRYIGMPFSDSMLDLVVDKKHLNIKKRTLFFKDVNNDLKKLAFNPKVYIKKASINYFTEKLRIFISLFRR